MRRTGQNNRESSQDTNPPERLTMPSQAPRRTVRASTGARDRSYAEPWENDDPRRDPDWTRNRRTQSTRRSSTPSRREPHTPRSRRVVEEIIIEDSDYSTGMSPRTSREEYFAATEYRRPRIERTRFTAPYQVPNRRYCTSCRSFVPEALRRIQCGHEICNMCYGLDRSRCINCRGE